MIGGGGRSIFFKGGGEWLVLGGGETTPLEGPPENPEVV